MSPTRSALLIGLLSAAPLVPEQKFFPDDPIRVDRDDLPIEMPKPIELSPTYDLLENTFAPPGHSEIPRAMNANTLGEVPDSSWFTNRIGVREMSREELVTGPGRGGPPRLPLTVIAGKSTGITPGFTARDATGALFFVKFDPREHPNLSTAAEVIGKNFFHAIGYAVSDSFIVYLREPDLLIETGAQVRVGRNEKRALDREFLDGLLDRAAHHPDGSVRAVASLALPGEPLGPFKFYGTRPDDPNDVFPHEHRRELRGYRVFCAWLNHDDSRSINTLDTYVGGESGRGYVRHHLIDFSSTLGSGSDTLRRIAPQDPRAGNEYVIDFEPIWKAAYTFGIRDRWWRKVPYAYPEFSEAGRIEAEFFDPPRWKPEYPNPAFDRLLPDDAFWAAKIVARFDDRQIRDIVSTGEFLSGETERFLAETVIARRDKIVDHYFRQLNPLDGFSVGGSLSFRNLGADRGLAAVEGYEYQWFSFDNQTGELAAIDELRRTEETSLPLPGRGAEFLMARIRTLSAAEPRWKKAVDVYLRRGEIVGIEREI